MVVSTTLTGVLYGQYYRNPCRTGKGQGNSAALSSACGYDLCDSPNLGCDYGCVCFNNNGVESKVGMFYADVVRFLCVIREALSTDSHPALFPCSAAC